MSKHLLDEQPLIVLPELACRVGLNEAIVLQQVHYWLKINQKAKNNLRDGRTWTYNTFEEWQEQFPFWGIATIKRIFKSLESQGLLIVDNYNKLKMDRTKWYSIDYDKLQTQQNQPLNQNDTMQGINLIQSKVSKRYDAKYQNDTTNTRDYTETNTETTAEEEGTATAAAKITSVFLFQQEFGRLLSPVESRTILSLEDDFGFELVKEALTRAVVNGKRNIRYVQAILNRWHGAGLRTIYEVLEYEQEIESRKQQKNPVINLSEEAAKKLEKDKKKRAEVIESAVSYITIMEKLPPDDPQAIEYAKGYDEVIPGVSMDIIAELQKMGGLAHGIN